MVWRRMESAPRDGTDILILTHDWGIVQGRWDGEVRDFYDELANREGPLGAWVSDWRTGGDPEPRLYCGATAEYWRPIPKLPKGTSHDPE